MMHVYSVDKLRFWLHGVMTLHLTPSEIFYTQDSIDSQFRTGQNIGDCLDKLVKGDLTVSSFPTISVCLENGKWWTQDNRRLWVFKQLERLGMSVNIPVNKVSFNRSKTTINGGTSIEVRNSVFIGGEYHLKPDNYLKTESYLATLLTL